MFLKGNQKSEVNVCQDTGPKQRCLRTFLRSMACKGNHGIIGNHLPRYFAQLGHLPKVELNMG